MARGRVGASPKGSYGKEYKIHPEQLECVIERLEILLGFGLERLDHVISADVLQNTTRTQVGKCRSCACACACARVRVRVRMRVRAASVQAENRQRAESKDKHKILSAVSVGTAHTSLRARASLGACIAHVCARLSVRA